MLVQAKGKKVSYYKPVEVQSGPLNVFKEDERHYYVRNSLGVIQGILKENLEPLGIAAERKLKLERILEIKKVAPVKELTEYNTDVAKIKVNWSGAYPNLCSGTWTVMINEMVLPIPEEQMSSDMGTEGSYSTWSFDEDYSETFSDYYDENDDSSMSWLNYSLQCLAEGYSLKFVGEKDLARIISDEISEQDWRSGSCGGCI